MQRSSQGYIASSLFPLGENSHHRYWQLALKRLNWEAQRSGTARSQLYTRIEIFLARAATLELRNGGLINSSLDRFYRQISFSLPSVSPSVLHDSLTQQSGAAMTPQMLQSLLHDHKGYAPTPAMPSLKLIPQPPSPHLCFPSIQGPGPLLLQQKVNIVNP